MLKTSMQCRGFSTRMRVENHVSAIKIDISSEVLRQKRLRMTVSKRVVVAYERSRARMNRASSRFSPELMTVQAQQKTLAPEFPVYRLSLYRLSPIAYRLFCYPHSFHASASSDVGLHAVSDLRGMWNAGRATASLVESGQACIGSKSRPHRQSGKSDLDGAHPYHRQRNLPSSWRYKDLSKRRSAPGRSVCSHRDAAHAAQSEDRKLHRRSSQRKRCAIGLRNLRGGG
jgi:hypothetical protein